MFLVLEWSVELIPKLCYILKRKQILMIQRFIIASISFLLLLPSRLCAAASCVGYCSDMIVRLATAPTWSVLIEFIIHTNSQPLQHQFFFMKVKSRLIENCLLKH